MNITNNVSPQQPTRSKSYGPAKTHSNISEVKKEELKFRPIINQTWTYTYNAAQVISKYLKPLSKNEYTIDDTQVFSKHIKDLSPLQEDEKDVLYDVEALFTNISIH